MGVGFPAETLTVCHHRDMDVTTAANEVEVISRAYARIHGLDRTDDWILLKFQEEVGELTQAYLEMTGRSRSRHRDAEAAFRGEVADVFAQLLVLARRFAIDIPTELETKWYAFKDVVTDEDRSGVFPIAAEETVAVLATVDGQAVDVGSLAVMPLDFDQVHRFAQPGSPRLVPYELRSHLSSMVAACERDYADYLDEIIRHPVEGAGPGERWLRETGPVPLRELAAQSPAALVEFLDAEAYQLLLHWELWGVLHSGNSPQWSIACVDSCRLDGEEILMSGRCFAVEDES